VGWALEHLGPARCAQVARELFRVTAIERGELKGICPLHDDRNASLSYNPEKDLAHCFGCDQADGDLVDLFAAVRGLDKREGLKAFRQSYAPGETSGTRPPARPDRSAQGETGSEQAKIIPTAEWDALPPLSEAWQERLERERGWSRAVMRFLGLRLWAKGDAERVAIPVHDGEGRLVNARLYQPGAGEGKVISWGKGYGTVRLLPSGELPPEEPLWLVEGEPDWICALSHGLNAVCTTGGAGTFKPHWGPRFRGRRVVVVYDADQAGQDGAAKVVRELAKHAASVRVLVWPQDVPQHFDLTDWFVKLGKSRADLEALADQTEPVTPQRKGSDQADDEALKRFRAWSAFDNKDAYRPMLLVDELIREHHLITDRETGLAYAWNGKVWRPILPEELGQLAWDKLGLAASRNRVNEARELIRCITMLPEGQPMNPSPEWLCCANGMVNLISWQIEPHNPKFRCTFIFDWPFDPNNPADCPRFKQYLIEVGLDPKTIATLQEFAGYSLWAQNPFKKALFLVGPGNSGKSLFLNMMQALVGEENCANINLGDLQDQFLRVTLHRRALNVFSEADAKFFTSDFFKAITGGDRLTAAYKHLPAFEFRPHCKLAFSMNNFPRVADSSSAFYNRILPVSFNRVFGPGEADPNLENKLKQEMPGVFAWAMVGLARLRQRGYFALSPSSRRLLNEFKYESNPVQGFLEEACTTRPFISGDKAHVDKTEFYRAYATWAKANGYQPRSRNSLFRTIKDLEPGLKETRPSVDGSRERRLEGIRLLEFAP